MENSSRFFKNSECSYFPCHKITDGEDFNCMFCYCPLYERTPCPGNPTYIKKDDGRIIKRCTDCTFPHKSENYDKIMALLRTAKPTVEFEEYHHGGEVKQNPALEIDFSVNTNPLGLPEGVKSAVSSSLDSLSLYPDQNCSALRSNLAVALRGLSGKPVSSENIIMGNGASELISLFTQAVSPKSALIVAPTFSGYERALKICYSKINYHFMSEESGFSLDETIFPSINKFNPDMIFLCSPNNPTGRAVDSSLLEKLVSECEEKGIFLFVDECFIGFTDREKESCVRLAVTNPHLIVLNAFTKIYAMAGIRLGYAVSSNQALLSKVNFLRPEWNVSSLAQTAGLAALKEHDYVLKTKDIIRAEREYLSKELKGLGFEVFPSEANFILFKITAENNDCMSKKLDNLLQNHGILLRNCGNFKGLSGQFYRTAVRNHEDNEKLIDSLKD